MPSTYMNLGGVLLLVYYTYDPGKPASGPYAPEYPTLEVESIEQVGLGYESFLAFIEDLSALPAFKALLLAHLEKEGSLR